MSSHEQSRSCTETNGKSFCPGIIDLLMWVCILSLKTPASLLVLPSLQGPAWPSCRLQSKFIRTSSILAREKRKEGFKVLGGPVRRCSEDEMSRGCGNTSNPFLPRVSPSGAPFIVRSVCVLAWALEQGSPRGHRADTRTRCLPWPLEYGRWKKIPQRRDPSVPP